MIRQIDVARNAGVSQATVSLVLGGKSGGKRVGEETRKRIEQVAKAMGYFHNSAAQQLRGSRSGLIGVLVGVSAAPVIFDRISALEREALSRGYRILLGQFGEELELAAQYIKDFAARRVEGTLCMSHEHREHPGILEKIISGLPNVVYLRQPAIEGAHYIHVDAADCIHQGVDYLLSTGRKRIGLVILDEFHQSNRHRYQGYFEAMQRNGLTMDENLIWVGDDTLLPQPHEVSNSKADEVVSFLVGQHHADAIIAINDDWAAQLIKAIRRRGLNVPHDVGIVGQGNFKIASFFDPEITTLDPQNGVFAKAAIDLLTGLIQTDNSALKKPVIVKPKLIIRQST
ncbi:MAG: LacI family DNA-binding transcriptional regulator [Kiritimatiellae bacterium]|nr:LacI family DNA-binding transcriptional regulator [Kiritimatiellia bacterium]